MHPKLVRLENQTAIKLIGSFGLDVEIKTRFYHRQKHAYNASTNLTFYSIRHAKLLITTMPYNILINHVSTKLEALASA